MYNNKKNTLPQLKNRRIIQNFYFLWKTSFIFYFVVLNFSCEFKGKKFYKSFIKQFSENCFFTHKKKYKLRKNLSKLGEKFIFFFFFFTPLENFDFSEKFPLKTIHESNEIRQKLFTVSESFCKFVEITCHLQKILNFPQN
jgi:hypothetical protein